MTNEYEVDYCVSITCRPKGESDDKVIKAEEGDIIVLYFKNNNMIKGKISAIDEYGISIDVNQNLDDVEINFDLISHFEKII